MNKDKMEKDNISVVIYVDSTLVDNIDSLAEITAKIATDGFGADKEMSPSRMKDKLIKEGSLIIISVGDKPVGFQTQKIITRDYIRLMYYSRVVSKGYQGKGIGSRMFVTSLDFFKPNIVVARSQNPAALYSSTRELRKNGAKIIFPFDQSFDESAEAKDALIWLIESLGYSIDKINLSTGVHKAAYSEKKLGDYEIRSEHPGIKAMEERLNELGLDRMNGDAVFYLALY